MSRKLTIGFVTILLSFSLTSCSLSNPKETFQKNKENKAEVEVDIKQNEKTFKALCRPYNYEELERYPQKYEGTPIVLEGTVLQVIENGDKINLAVDVTNNGDIVYISYTKQDKNEPRILEDDKIKLWGEFQGITSYETVLGHALMLPSIQAAYIELKVEQPVTVPQAKNNYYMLPDSAVRYLTDNDLRTLSGYQLKIGRNEIYARHGYIFETEEMKAYFNNQAWYTPTISADRFTDEMLSDIERYNIDFIRAYEGVKK